MNLKTDDRSKEAEGRDYDKAAEGMAPRLELLATGEGGR